jgi:hypothetical protein
VLLQAATAADRVRRLYAAHDHAQSHGHDAELIDSTGPDDIPGFEYIPERRGSESKGQRWPVRPIGRQHYVRGSFNDPRPTRPPTYHFGIDVLVNDARPAANAPRGRSHRVYAVESGRVQVPPNDANAACTNRKLQVGNFSYWHVDSQSTVRAGEWVEAGEPIGWTCKGNWHAHISEWDWVDGKRTWVNPLRKGGQIAPWHDYRAPIIHELGFFTPANVRWRRVDGGKRLEAAQGGKRLNQRDLHGKVDLRAWIGDPQPTVPAWVRGTPPLIAEQHPQRTLVSVRDARTGALVLRRTFTNDVIAKERLPFDHHYGPGTRQNLPAAKALQLAGKRPGDNEYHLRLFGTAQEKYWDTTDVRDGRYRIYVEATDVAGNKARAYRNVTVNNRRSAARH